MACMLGAMLTKDEVDEFMREADVVRHNLDSLKLIPERPTICIKAVRCVKL